MNFLNVRPANNDKSSNDQRSMAKILSAAFGCAIVLMILLGAKLISVENRSGSYQILLHETREKIKSISTDFFNIQKKVSSQKNEDLQLKIELFSKLNKRVKVLEKLLRKTQKRKGNDLQNLQTKSREQMGIYQRINLLQQKIQEQTVMLDFLENNAKEVVRQTKIAKFDQISKFQYFKPEKRRNPWILQRFNIKTPFIDSLQKRTIQQQLKKQQDRLEATYQMSRYTSELPFCIIVPSFNNARNFRYEFNLQSIFNQDYDNYRVVVVDDASSDNTTALIKHFMKKNKKYQDKVVLITNKKQMTAVPNIHMAITKHCKENQIGFFVDGDDELVGRQVFRVFNTIYQSKKPAVAYSISLEYWDGWSKPYSDEQKQNNQYRDVPQKISHLRSFRVDLYLQIKERDLKDINGEWFKSTYDEVICLPMLEMSCGNIQYIDDYFYLYVYGTGFNDRLVDSTLQWSIANYVKTKMPKYTCNKKYGRSNAVGQPAIDDKNQGK